MGARCYPETVDGVAGPEGHNSALSWQSKTNEPPIKMFKVTNNLYEEFTSTLRKGTYKILVAGGFEHCMQQLPWWQNYHKDSLVSTVSSDTKVLYSKAIV